MLVLTRLSRYIHAKDHLWAFRTRTRIYTDCRYTNSTYSIIHSMLNYMFVGAMFLRHTTGFVYELVIFDGYLLYIHCYQNDKYETFILKHSRCNIYIDF